MRSKALFVVLGMVPVLALTSCQDDPTAVVPLIAEQLASLFALQGILGLLVGIISVLAGGGV